MSEVRLLQIHYFYPPVRTVAAHRLANWSNAAADRGAELYVLTVRNRGQFEVEPLPLPQHQRLEIAVADWRRLYSRLWQNTANTLPESVKTSGLGRFLRKLTDTFPFSLLLGTGGLVYIWLAYRQGQRVVRKNKITHIVSSFRPLADHVIAYLLKRRFPELIWIADFRDPVYDPVRRNAFWPARQAGSLRRLLRRADHVTTVSLGLARHFKLIHQDVRVLYNWLVPPLSTADWSWTAPGCYLGYTGSLYPEVQSAEPVLQVLAHSPWYIAYAGRHGAIWKQWLKTYRLSNRLLDLGERSHQEALAIQRAATVNLLLTWRSDRHGGILTAKLFEYLAAGKPILAIVCGPLDEELETLLKPVPHLQISTLDPTAQERVATFLARWHLEQPEPASRVDGRQLWREQTSSLW